MIWQFQSNAVSAEFDLHYTYVLTCFPVQCCQNYNTAMACHDRNFKTRYPTARSLTNGVNSSVCWPPIVGFEVSFTQQHFSLFSYLGLMQFIMCFITDVQNPWLTCSLIPSSATCKINHMNLQKVWVWNFQYTTEYFLATFCSQLHLFTQIQNDKYSPHCMYTWLTFPLHGVTRK